MSESVVKNNDNLISCTRTSIMGFAALWIMLFHGTMEVPINGVMTFIKIGYLGVDIFMFMSGFSMYHSFGKSGEKNFNAFIKRRMAKILPTFIPFTILWIIGYLLENYKTIELLLVGMRSLDFWITMLTFRWFVPCILFCYFITPIIQKVFERFGFKYRTLIFMIIPFFIAGTLFNGSSVALMFLLRFPTYIIGYFYGENEHKKNNVYLRISIIIVGYTLYYFLLKKYTHNFLSNSGLYWYPAVFLTSSMVVCLAHLAKWVKSKFVILLGEYSFEVYLWHLYLLFPCLEYAKQINLSFDRYGIVINLICIGLTVMVSCIYTKVIDILMGILKH